ncbi:MAG: response regulator [Pseudolabrys sp.]
MQEKPLESLIHGLDILIVDGNTFMRSVTRMMLMNLGARSVTEAADGLTALEMIRDNDPDVVLLEWDIPTLGGMELMRIVRSPRRVSAPQYSNHHADRPRPPLFST